MNWQNGPHFWGLACGVPAFIWSLVASVRWLFFITQYIRADAWNKRREEVILQETRRGRRALQILSFSVQTALNGDSVAETTAAFLARQQVLNTYVDLRGEDTVRRSVIPVLTNKPVTGRLSEIISRLFIDIRPQLFLLPPDFHINVLLEIDAPLSGASVRTIWQDEWQKPDSRKPVCFLPGAGAGRRGRLAGQLYSGKDRTAGDFRVSGTEDSGTDGRILHRAVAGKPVDANRADAAGPAASS